MPFRPNIILICADQWRGDCLSIAGHPVVHTPFLDRLAVGGVRFSRAYAACPTCIPARASLYTGLTPRSHGRVGYQDGVPWNYPLTIASEFTRNGYQTQAVGKLHVFPERSQIGFQNVELHDGFLHYARRNNADLGRIDDYLPWLRRESGQPYADYCEHGLDCNGNVARPWDKAEYLHPTNWVASRSIDFLRRRDTRKPFFLYVGFHRPHPPYDPPAWAFEQYLNSSMPDVPRGSWASTLSARGHDYDPTTQIGHVRPDVLRRARAGYYGHMTHIDHQISRLLQALPEYSAGPTVICFVSDHGEMMGDHDLWRKSLPYEGSARVPLILWAPAELGLSPDSERRELAELRDVFPTLLQCAGLDVPPGIEGKSLLPLARGQEPGDWRTYLHGEHTVYDQSVQFITDERWKYVWFSGTGQEQLFDLQNDPQELHQLSDSPQVREPLERLRACVVRELSGREEGFIGPGALLQPGRSVRACLSHVLPDANCNH